VVVYEGQCATFRITSGALRQAHVLPQYVILRADFRICNCSQSAWLMLRQQPCTWCLIQYIFFLVSSILTMSARPVSMPSRRHPLQRYNSPSKGFSGALHVGIMIPGMQTAWLMHTSGRWPD
jgi:hypothetical protein